MLNNLMAMIALVTIALLAWAWLTPSAPRKGGYGDERARQPPEIADGKLVISETYFNSDLPRPLGARCDQVYRVDGGILVPVETKVRYRQEARIEDIVELSVQASVLRNTRSKSRPFGIVASWGYVRIAPKDRPVTYIKVQLMDDDELATRYDRYFAVQEGAKPERTGTPRNCLHCPKIQNCLGN